MIFASVHPHLSIVINKEQLENHTKSIIMDIAVTKQNTKAFDISREQIVAVACVTVFPLLYLAGKALMTVLPS